MSAHAVQHGLEHWKEALNVTINMTPTPVVLLLTNKSFIPINARNYSHQTMLLLVVVMLNTVSTHECTSQPRPVHQCMYIFIL